MSEQQQQRPSKPIRPVAPARRSETAEGQSVDAEQALRERNEDLGHVQVAYGPHEGWFNVAGKTVAYVRENLAHVFNIPPGSLPVATMQGVRDTIADAQAESEYVLQPKSRLEFMADAGEKGVSP
jgi:hypothetical protein